jgi:sigma-B regulation protein RsbU (phosphoserine phosphatase)
MTLDSSRLRIVLLVNYLDRAYQNSFRNALERAARSRGVDLFVAVGRELEHELSQERVLNRLFQWLSPESIHGAVLLSAALSNFSGPEGVLRLCYELAPVPCCSIGLRLPDVPSILIDNRTAMQTAVAHLIQEHGCRNIGYIGGPDYNEEARARLRGYRDALDAAGIPCEPQRVVSGLFTTKSGYTGVCELVSRGLLLDAVVAANDDMALGAVDALFELGKRVPEDVKVVGFDDAPIARFARRSLTTVAQPFDDIAALSLDALIGQLRGTSNAAALHTVGARLVTRESCGCGYVLAQPRSARAAPARPPAEYLRAWSAELERRATPESLIHVWQPLVPALALGLARELEQESGAFLSCVEQLADQLAERPTSGDEIGRALVELQRGCEAAGYRGADYHELGRACLEAQAKASAISHREHGRRALVVMESAASMRGVSQDLAMVLSSSALAPTFLQALHALGISTGFLAVRADEHATQLRPLLAIEASDVVELDPAPYPARQLFPRGFPRGTDPCFLTLLPLTVEDRVMGLVAFTSECEPFVCEALRSQLSAALELSWLHARVVEETAVRERLAHEQLLGELAVARRIQGALCPSDLEVPGFEIFAQLVPADQVGGDYYDVLRAADGCWVGIGDVTGHGLLAGLIMLMMQSSVSTAIQGSDHQTPAELVCQVNSVLQSNIRSRLQVKDHATFLLLRAYADGRMLMAGAHEDVILHRAATGRCELIELLGVWLGISADIRAATSDQAFHMEPGDTIVLYTDGLIEGRDATHREFGLERTIELVRAAAAQGPRAIVQSLTATARAWTPVQQDDITVVALRRTGG